jgi:glucokinase
LGLDRSTVVGVDVGGTKILVGSVRPDGAVVAARRYPMDRRDRAHTLASILDGIAGYWRELPTRLPPAAIGVGLVGLTDPATGAWLHSMSLHVDQPIELGAELRARYGLPVAVDNDVHAATLAELRFGAGREARDFVYLNVGTGLAGGLVCNGQLVRGALNYAGELGHSLVGGPFVGESDDLCPCGRRGCVEMYASGGAIVESVRLAVGRGEASSLAPIVASGALTSADVFHAADEGDALAIRVAERVLRGVGDLLVNLVNTLNPSAIVLGGGVVADGWLVPRVEAYVRRVALRNAARSLRSVALSSLPINEVGLLGAATLALGMIETLGTLAPPDLERLETEGKSRTEGIS